MMYSSRTHSKKSYRFGYATSPDALSWTRRDAEVGIDISGDGWDSQALSYGSVVQWRDRTYLFYNGNDMGMTGFGYAELAEA